MKVLPHIHLFVIALGSTLIPSAAIEPVDLSQLTPISPELIARGVSKIHREGDLIVSASSVGEFTTSDDDGATWKRRRPAQFVQDDFIQFSASALGNGTFVTLDNSQWATTTDFKNWQTGGIGISNPVATQLAYDGTGFLASSARGILLRSPNGQDWTIDTSYPADAGRQEQIAISTNGVIVTAGEKKIISSSNGTTWEVTEFPSLSRTIGYLSWAGDRFLRFGDHLQQRRFRLDDRSHECR